MLHLHSLLRWAVLFLLLLALVRSIFALIQKKEFTAGDGKTGLYLMIFTHLQLVLGLVLYFTQGWAEAPMAESMKDAAMRFWKVEHIFAMIVAVALITVGRIRTKKQINMVKGHQTSLIFYGISLLIILWAIPWEMARLI